MHSSKSDSDPNKNEIEKISLADFELRTFNHEQVNYPMYVKKGEGPAILVLHEIPGLTPKVIRFAGELLKAGFSVFMPSLFGTPEKEVSLPYYSEQIARACINREFQLFAKNQSSSITRRLKVLCQQIFSEVGGNGIGVIGMCITGNFALSLAMERSVIAGVLSQPSLPVGFTKAVKHALHISPEELQNLKDRVAKGNLDILGLRFTHDPLCPKERFQRLRDELGSHFKGIEINSGPGNPDGFGCLAHSVVTEELFRENNPNQPTKDALKKVLDYFDQKLK